SNAATMENWRSAGAAASKAPDTAATADVATATRTASSSARNCPCWLSKTKKSDACNSQQRNNFHDTKSLLAQSVANAIQWDLPVSLWRDAVTGRFVAPRISNVETDLTLQSRSSFSQRLLLARARPFNCFD